MERSMQNWHTKKKKLMEGPPMYERMTWTGKFF